MGEAKRRKALGLPPRPAPAKVREVKLLPPTELMDRLEKLRPTQYPLEDWLVGALAAFAEFAEKENERQKYPSIIVPATKLPKLPAGSLLGGRA